VTHDTVCVYGLAFMRLMGTQNEIAASLNLFRIAFITQTVGSLCLCLMKMKDMIRQIFWMRCWKN